MMTTSETMVYPWTDEHGYTWLDPSGFDIDYLKSAALNWPMPCFICNRKTRRIDIDYNGFFCNSYACNLTIELDLKGIIPWSIRRS
jgi:hypothetical protein